MANLAVFKVLQDLSDQLLRQFMNLATLLRHWHKIRRRDLAQLRMPPAQQGFHTYHGIGGQVVLGLVHHGKFLGGHLERCHQGLGQPLLVLPLLPFRGTVYPIAGAARQLGFLFQFNDGRKLIPRQARNHIPLSQNTLNAGRRLLKHPIPAIVAMEIVHGFEEIQIDVEHRKAVAFRLALADPGLQELLEQGTVRQLGEWIVVGKRRQAFIARSYLAHIHEDPGEQPLAVVFNRIDGQPLGIIFAALAAIPDQAFPAPAVIETLPHGLIELRGVQPGTQHRRSPAKHFLWQTIQGGESWRGVVKNRCKNGDHYWVDAYVTPILKNGEMVEFQSVRSRPTRAQIHRAEKAYAAWRKGHLPRRYQAISPPLMSKLACLYATLAGSLVLFGLAELTLQHMLVMQTLVLAVFVVLFWLTLPLMQTARETGADAHPVMPWIYTGRRDEGAWIEYDRQKRDSTLRAVSARMHANIGVLHGRKQRTVEWVSSSVASIRSQQTGIESITRAFEELAQSVHRVDEMTNRTQQASADARQSAHQCQNRMNGVNQAISSLRSQLTGANQEMEKLTEHSNTISLVLEVISDIAEQTNLLALQVERQAEHLLQLGNQSVQSSESAHQESEQLGNNVDQAQLLTSHFLKMLCDRLLAARPEPGKQQFPEPAQ